ncbi:MAG: helix-turn-helix domain-containing protein [Aestuariibacter sp.]
MTDSLSIRSYSSKPMNHAHDFHQLVLPLRGVISIQVGQFNGKVAPGECVIVRAREEHLFTANPEARFVVADMQTLPDNLYSYQGVVFAVKKSLSSYMTFVEEQLEQQLNPTLENAMFETFALLLSNQILMPKVDNRIATAMMFIEQNIQERLNINMLADAACLSSTQFKLLFRKQTGLPPMSYVTQMRMEKAQALLTHTDYPLQMIGEMVGYPDLSTFSRNFSQYYGLPPTKFKK